MQKWEYIELYVAGDDVLQENGQKIKQFGRSGSYPNFYVYLQEKGAQGWEVVGYSATSGGRYCLLKRAVV